MRTYALVFSGIAIPFAIWSLVPHQRRELSSLATQAGSWSIFFAWIGVCSYLALTRIFAWEFCDRFGKTYVAVGMIAAGTLAYMGFVGFSITWFVNQPDLEAVWASLESFAHRTTPILALVCGMKAIATFNVIRWSVRRQLYRLSAAFAVLSVWCVIVSIGVFFGRPLLHAVWMNGTNLVLAVMVATPLARPLLIPWATSVDRHRYEADKM
jgi:hypothetical protein